MGEGITVTNGLISAKDKEITVDRVTLNVVQTSAAINPGNSGGPLINLNGEVIGINTAKIMAQTAMYGSVEGMGYAIPSNHLIPIIERMLNRVSRPYFGILGQSMRDGRGVLVSTVNEGSSAEAGGIVSLDIILSYNGVDITSIQHLQDLLMQSEIGETVVVIVERDGEEITLNVPLISEYGGVEFEEFIRGE
jgi:serine protease Do